MRTLTLAIATAAVLAAGSLGNRADAMTIGSPAGLRHAIEDTDLTELPVGMASSPHPLGLVGRLLPRLSELLLQWSGDPLPSPARLSVAQACASASSPPLPLTSSAAGWAVRVTAQLFAYVRSGCGAHVAIRAEHR
jgi:hypothetical protein